jgi:hypothetical protein
VTVYGDRTFKEVIMLNEVIKGGPNLIGLVYLQEETSEVCVHREKATERRRSFVNQEERTQEILNPADNLTWHFHLPEL